MRRCLAVFLTSWMRENLQRSLQIHDICSFPLTNFTISHDVSLTFFSLIHQEAEEILELLRSTWRTLGITETVHDTCYAWVLFRQVNPWWSKIKAKFVEILFFFSVLPQNIFTTATNMFHHCWLLSMNRVLNWAYFNILGFCLKVVQLSKAGRRLFRIGVQVLCLYIHV